MKVAYYDERKFRVVTTKGELIDSSGTITQLALKNSPEDQRYVLQKLDNLKRLKASLSHDQDCLTSLEEDALSTLRGI